jgi:hypothetical protein
MTRRNYATADEVKPGEAALYVWSPKLGEAAMTGRLYRDVGDDDWVFYHEVGKSETGLVKEDNSHGGVDAAVVRYLLRLEGDPAIVVHHQGERQGDDVCYATTLNILVGQSHYHAVGGRFRLFLPDHHWALFSFNAPDKHLPRRDLPIVEYDPREEIPGSLEGLLAGKR